MQIIFWAQINLQVCKQFQVGRSDLCHSSLLAGVWSVWSEASGREGATFWKKPFLNSTGWCLLGTVLARAKKPRKTTYSALEMHQSRCFPSSFSEGTLHTHTHPPHHRTPSFSNYSLDDEVNLIHLVTLAKLLAGDSQHQQGEVLNQSWTELDCKHSQREGGSAPLEARGDGSGMLSAGHGASAADTVVSTVSFCLGFVQGLYFAELLCISFLSCNLSL